MQHLAVIETNPEETGRNIHKYIIPEFIATHAARSYLAMGSSMSEL